LNNKQKEMQNSGSIKTPNTRIDQDFGDLIDMWVNIYFHS
jgi:hypothetical protein